MDCSSDCSSKHLSIDNMQALTSLFLAMIMHVKAVQLRNDNVNNEQEQKYLTMCITG